MKLNFFKGFVTTAVVALLGGYGVTQSVNNNTDSDELTLSNLEALAHVEIDPDLYVGVKITIPIDDFSIRSNRCVCKSGYCSDGAWISFRKSCGSGDSDSYCGQYSCR